jgi:two-component system sensor histidine kinase KdpD
LRSYPVRILLSIGAVVVLTWVSRNLLHLNATTAGFLCLLLILIIASTWGFVEAAVLSVAASLLINFYFLPPVGTLTIADPQNSIALFTFLIISLIASRLSTKAKRRAQDAIDRQRDIERLYTLSRSILLIGVSGTFQNELARKVAEAFGLNAVVLYDRRSGEFFRAGPSDFESMDPQLRDSAAHGTAFSDAKSDFVITAVRLGSEPIASLGLQSSKMPDSVLQGIANLVAIGLERARAQDLAHQVIVAQQSEQLRTTLIDAMAHEFKTPLTAIRAATTMLLANPDQPVEDRQEMLKVADEEAEHLRKLIDNTIEMARLDTAHIEIKPELADLGMIIDEVVGEMRPAVSSRPLEVYVNSDVPHIAMDRRLIKLAIKQLLDNALKYSPDGTPLRIQVSQANSAVTVDITDHGKGIPLREQQSIFERFFRSPSVQQQVPGSGLGLNIARSIARAHHGDLTVTSQPGETTFHLTLPSMNKGDRT